MGNGILSGMLNFTHRLYPHLFDRKQQRFKAFLYLLDGLCMELLDMLLPLKFSTPCITAPVMRKQAGSIPKSAEFF